MDITGVSKRLNKNEKYLRSTGQLFEFDIIRGRGDTWDGTMHIKKVTPEQKERFEECMYEIFGKNPMELELP